MHFVHILQGVVVIVAVVLWNWFANIVVVDANVAVAAIASQDIRMLPFVFALLNLIKKKQVDYLI